MFRYLKRIGFPLVIAVITSCASGGSDYDPNFTAGELVGTGRAKIIQERPYGMVYIPAGVYVMGTNTPDITGVLLNPLKTVSLSGFYMDDTEITNDEYRQFVNWVKDSILREYLAIRAEELIKKRGIAQSSDNISVHNKSMENKEDAAEGGDGEVPDKEAPEKEEEEDALTSNGPLTQDDLDNGIYRYRYIKIDTAISPYYQYVYKKYSEKERTLARIGYSLNWDEDIIWKLEEVSDIEYAEVLENLLTPIEKALTSTSGKRELDESKLYYSYYDNGKSVNPIAGVLDSLHEEIKSNDLGEGLAENTGGDQSQLMKALRKATISTKIHPDIKVWLRDFAYTFNDPMYNQYFWHVSYDDYPVVGVNWKQAMAFCNWRTKTRNNYLKSVGRALVNDYRLPTEAEWEFSARGGLPSAKYPWGGPYTYDQTGCFLANFKPRRGDYLSDGSLYTAPTRQYKPNDYGLYDMSGNVAEWTGTSYHPSGYMFESTMNPNFFDETTGVIVTRGGSWKDISYFLQVHTRDYEKLDSSFSYLGFRTVLDFIDESNFVGGF